MCIRDRHIASAGLLRAGRSPFASRIRPAGRSLETPDLGYKYARQKKWAGPVRIAIHCVIRFVILVPWGLVESDCRVVLCPDICNWWLIVYVEVFIVVLFI